MLIGLGSDRRRAQCPESWVRESRSKSGCRNHYMMLLTKCQKAIARNPPRHPEQAKGLFHEGGRVKEGLCRGGGILRHGEILRYAQNDDTQRGEFCGIVFLAGRVWRTVEGGSWASSGPRRWQSPSRGRLMSSMVSHGTPSGRGLERLRARDGGVSVPCGTRLACTCC
jgi:hypothetical protein